MESLSKPLSNFWLSSERMLKKTGRAMRTENARPPWAYHMANDAMPDQRKIRGRSTTAVCGPHAVAGNRIRPQANI